MKKCVVSSLEGGRKSSGNFQRVEKIATPENPALFAMKTYELCAEQIETWSELFNIPKSEFAICGCNTSSEKAMEFYTNKEFPSMIGKNVRFVLATQASLQKENHLKFVHQDSLKRANYCEVLIDEFDFSVLIPSLDYELNNMQGGTEKEKIEQARLTWIGKNYTHTDVVRVQIMRSKHDKGFIPASWVIDCPFPMTFLTSEVLATEILELIGFEKEYIGEKAFKDCVINVWANENVNNVFIDIMNQELAWNKLDCDLIISDKINAFFQNDNSLKVTAISHTAIRGSNNWRNRKILTILSHIPQQFLKQIRDTFHYFGVDKSYEDVVGLFYRDRLCQAVGRVIGYRGGKETNVIMHSDLLKEIQKLKNFPYTINDKWDFTFDGFDTVLEKVINAKLNKKKLNKNPELITYSFLEDYFFEKPTSFIQLDELRDYCKKHRILNAKRDNVLSATKIAKYFNKNVIVKRIKDKTVRVISGLALKKQIKK